MSKPAIVITVSGGCAEYQVLPAGAEVDVVLVDYDHLKDCEACPADVQEKIDQVKALPEADKQSKEFKEFVLDELQEILETHEYEASEFENDALKDTEGV